MSEDEFKFDDNQSDDFLNNPFDGNPDDEEKEIRVLGVYEQRMYEESQQSEYVILVRDQKERTVPIVIGRSEAMAISIALEGHSADRPLTHDLLNNVISKLGGKVERILIDDLWNSTYYAKISITADNRQLEIDSRPSDAIALALRAKAPIFMAEHVLESAGLKEE